MSDAQLADYAANHARYQAVILASGDLGAPVSNRNGTTSFLSAFSDAEWATLAKFERTFGIRRLSDYTAPSPAHGLDTGRRRVAGRPGGARSPRRQRRVPVPQGSGGDRRRRPAAAETFGYPATPVNAAGLADAARRARTTPRTSASTRTRTTAARRWS